jgi:hypothetical protein
MQDIFGLTLLFCAHLNRNVVWRSILWANFVIKLSNSFSGFVILSRQLGTLKKTRLNHDVSDLQVGALEKCQSSRLGIPSWVTVQNVFSQSELVYFRFPSCEFAVVLKSDISQFSVSSCFEGIRSQAGLTAWPMYSTFTGPWCCMWMFILLSLEKRSLNPDLDHIPTPLNSRLVIDLQHLQLATDSFQTTHGWFCDFQLVV